MLIKFTLAVTEVSNNENSNAIQLNYEILFSKCNKNTKKKWGLFYIFDRINVLSFNEWLAAIRRRRITKPIKKALLYKIYIEIYT